MAAFPESRISSPEAYLAMERISPVKHEYVNGNIFQMAGTSADHGIITVNIASSINVQFKGRECNVFASDMRVFIPATGLYTYPDVVALCGERQMVDDNHFDNLLNPTVIVEVLSKSTAQYDTGRKLDHYRSIDSLQHYLMVWQDVKRALLYSRRDENWTLQDFIGGDAVIELPAIDCTLSMDEIYDKVDLRVK